MRGGLSGPLLASGASELAVDARQVALRSDERALGHRKRSHDPAARRAKLTADSKTACLDGDVSSPDMVSRQRGVEDWGRRRWSRLLGHSG